MTPRDREALDALKACPMTTLELAYRTRRRRDPVLRTLQRLRLTGRVVSLRELREPNTSGRRPNVWGAA